MITIRENFLGKSKMKLINMTRISVDLKDVSNMKHGLVFCVNIRVPKKIVEHDKLFSGRFELLESFITIRGVKLPTFKEEKIKPSEEFLESIKDLIDYVNKSCKAEFLLEIEDDNS